jgi:SNF2 family DNA or RNA helicase
MNKVIDYNAFKKVYKPTAADNEAAFDNSGSDDTDTSESETDDESGVNSDGDLRDFIVPDHVESTDDETGDDKFKETEDIEGLSPPRNPESKGKSKSKKSRRKDKGKGKEKEKTKTSHLSIAMLKKESSKSSQGRRRYMKYLKKNWQPSAKVTKCVELLDKFREEGRKTIIFSQFVSLLDLLQVPIDEKQWKCLRYDGSMSAEARNDNIVKFTDSNDHNIMLISLKAGNAGLNLVAASRVIILDPFWNPFIEMQAVDRAYRIGQQRSVEVHRILIHNTVEDRIIELQENKRRLVDNALDEGANKDIGRLDVRQLAYLFGVGSNN